MREQVQRQRFQLGKGDVVRMAAKVVRAAVNYIVQSRNVSDPALQGEVDKLGCP